MYHSQYSLSLHSLSPSFHSLSLSFSHASYISPLLHLDKSDRYLNTDGTGELTLGGADMSAVEGPFVYTKLLELRNHYTVAINSVEVLIIIIIIIISIITYFLSYSIH